MVLSPGTLKNENLVRAANLKTIFENKWKGFLILWGVFDFDFKRWQLFCYFQKFVNKLIPET